MTRLAFRYGSSFGPGLYFLYDFLYEVVGELELRCTGFVVNHTDHLATDTPPLYLQFTNT